MIVKSLEHKHTYLTNKVEVSAVLEFDQRELMEIPQSMQRGIREILQFLLAKDFTTGSDTVIDLGSVCVLKGKYWKNPMAMEVLETIKSRGEVLFLVDVPQEEV